MQIEQPTAAARWVSGLGMRQLMAVWVLGSKMGPLSSGRGQRRHDVGSMMGLSLPLSRLSLSFLFFFLFFLRFWLFRSVLESLLTVGFSSSSSSFYFIYIYINVFIGS